ncbi:alpha/beta hydrolase [Streptomyces parvus]
MVQNQRDPGTPLVGACALRGALGERARMVTADLRGAVPTPSVRAPA